MSARLEGSSGRSGFSNAGVWIAVFTVFSNLLVLVMPVYMTQVYDRVLPSNSIETLIYLSLIAVIALAVFGGIESVRQKLAQKLSARYELTTMPVLLRAASAGREGADVSATVQKASVVKRFVGSNAFVSLFDLPFAPLFLAIMFMTHYVLGWLTVGGMVALSLVTWLNQWASNRPMEQSGQAQARAARFAADALGRIEDVRAMGMGEAMVNRWRGAAQIAAVLSDQAGHVNASYYGLVRFVRQTLQMLVLGVGAYLVITGKMSASLIFAASLVSSRALLPVEQMIGASRQISEAYRAHRDVSATIAASRTIEQRQLELPVPKGLLEVRKVTYAVGSSTNESMLLRNVNLTVRPGEIVAIIGASGSGKSTLARVLAGAVAPTAGDVKLDGFRLEQWPPAFRGRYIGYVGQDTILMEGTVAENIARFDPKAGDIGIIDAAKASQAHDFIGTLAEGYNTRVGANGVRLSGGQIQRLALARALYGNPAILILDEPNSHLDSSGEETMLKVLQAEAAKGRAIVVVTHRANTLQLASQVLVMDRGRLQPYAPKPVPVEPVVLRTNGTTVNVSQPSHAPSELRGAQS